MSQTKWLFLASLRLDSGTERVSSTRVRVTGSPPAYAYTGSVLQWGSIDQSVPIVSGPPEISDATVRLADTNRHWRDKYGEALRRRLFDIRAVEAGASLSTAIVIFTGECVDAVFGPGYVELTLRDRMNAWLDEPIPAMLVPELYPDIPPDAEGGFLSIIFGEMRSLGSELSPPTATGVIPCPHFGLIGSPPTADRYGLSATPIANLVRVYRNNGDTWEVVDESEYTLTEVFHDASNPVTHVEMTHVFIDFYADQNGAEIRADVDGIAFRGPWGPLPDVGNISPPAALLNPIDAFIGMTYLVLAKAGISEQVFDTEEIGALREQFEIGVGSPPVVYRCDGAITESLTCREWLGQFLPDFHLWIYQNDRGLITLRFLDEEDPDRPVFSEGKYIIRNTFFERLPETIANQFVFRYNYNPVRKEFETLEVYDTDDQDVMALTSESPPEDKIEKAVMDFYFARDRSTVLDVTQRRARLMAPGSYQQTFEVPMVRSTMQDCHIGKQVGLTHSQGLQAAGYVNEEAVIIGRTAHIDDRKFTLRTVLRVPRQLGIALEIRQYALYSALHEAFSAPLYLVRDIDEGNALIVAAFASPLLGDDQAPTLTDQLDCDWASMFPPDTLFLNAFYTTAPAGATDGDLILVSMNSSGREAIALEVAGILDGFTAVTKSSDVGDQTIYVTTGNEPGARLLVLLATKHFGGIDGEAAATENWEFVDGGPPDLPGFTSAIYQKTVSSPGTHSFPLVMGEGAMISGQFYLMAFRGRRSPEPSFVPLDRTDWTAYSDTELGSTWGPDNAIDNDLGSTFHSDTSGLPQMIWFDMGTAQRVGAIRIVPRQDDTFGFFIACNVYFSDDGMTWGSPVDSFSIPEDYTKAFVLNLSAEHVKRYVAIEATVQGGGGGYFTLAEVYPGYYE